MHNNDQLFDWIIILLIILVNAFFGALQDYKSEKANELLKKMLKTESVVLRNGIKVKIDSSELVPGDIIFLEEGSKVPADCRLLDAKNLKVNESVLTGESRSVSKNINTIKETLPLADRKNMIYMNTFIDKGVATAIVVETGKDTEMGKIAELLEENKEGESEFYKEVDYASKRITIVALVLIAIASYVLYLNNNSVIHILMIASALIIGSIPEGLPAIVTFTLALGAKRLAKNNVLVVHKAKLETLGSIDVLCTDKTGTLTENKMSIKRYFIDFKEQKDLLKLNKEILRSFMLNALLPNEAKDTKTGIVGCAEDLALFDAFNAINLNPLDFRSNFRQLNIEPFSSETRLVRSFNELDENKIIVTAKGSTEVILENSNYFLNKGKVERLTPEIRDKIHKKAIEYSQESLRVIAFSYSIIKKTEYKGLKNELPKKEIFLGFVGLYDKPKEGIKEVIKNIYNSNICIKMITGDNIETAKAIAKEVGFKNIRAINWDQIKNLSEEDFKHAVLNYNVFSRMPPDFEYKIVSLLQERGRRVAITGDGVNDVPALKKANIGVAMGLRGSDIAKDASDIILLDDNLRSVHTAIKEGRTIYSNVKKVINYLLTSNLAEVLVVFLSALKNLVPFYAIQLLWVNFVTDVAPAMAFGVDPSHKEIMKKKPTGSAEKLINKRIILLTILIGIKKVIIMMALFLVVLYYSKDLKLAQTFAFTWLVFSHFVRVAAIRFDEGVGLFVNKYLNWSLLIPVILQFIILYTPIKKFFRAVSLTLREWLVLLTALIIAIILARIITFIIDRYLLNKTELEQEY